MPLRNDFEILAFCGGSGVYAATVVMEQVDIRTVVRYVHAAVKFNVALDEMAVNAGREPATNLPQDSEMTV